MNLKQELFCQNYVSTKNATKSAIASGYNPKTAYSQGARLLKNVDIQKRIHELLEEKQAALPDPLELKTFWAQLMRDENQKTSIRLAASTNLAKALFLFNPDLSAWESFESKESEEIEE